MASLRGAGSLKTENRFSGCFYYSIAAGQSNRHLRFDMRVRVVIRQFKIVESEGKNVAHIGVDVHFGQRARFACELQAGLFKMVVV